MNVVLRLMEAAVGFVWWGGGGVCTLHSPFHVQPNYSVEVVSRCDVLGAVTITHQSINQGGDGVKNCKSTKGAKAVQVVVSIVEL